MNILVIDDEEQIRNLLETILTRVGYKVILAKDGEEGVFLFKKSKIDLIITDIIMPNQEGIATITELREKSPTIPIIAISGGGRIGAMDYLRMAKGLGANEVLKKPFDRKELLKIIENLLAS